ncbi:uncharacterized protein LOC127836568 isoform X1 [Dreissena polymorpha]|uniref:Uncharacterized protein n=1 Tax=Dreissena polymorpha TaxID=45954 RepID=A0A9D4FUB3_DREPO|nr:uncharacterized protein LOC127836568 isoform X1 [Dreissena polymorpha]KAH3804657.1 hypothetical protein DPMN_132947 [Dreissena polymorpha]
MVLRIIIVVLFVMFRADASCVNQYAEIGDHNVQLVFSFTWNTRELRKVVRYKGQILLGECIRVFVAECSVPATTVRVYTISSSDALTSMYITIDFFNDTTAGEYYCSTDDRIQHQAICIYSKVNLTSLTLLPNTNISYPVHNDQSTFTCITSPSRPVSRIHWFVEGRNITDMASYAYSSDIATSNLRYTPQSYNNKNLICTANYMFKSTNITLQRGTRIIVQYPVSTPSITINSTVVTETATVHKDIPVELQCSASGFPPPTYHWFYPGGFSFGDTVILKFNRTFRDENISCEATNSYYSLNGTITSFSTTSVTSIKIKVTTRPDIPKYFCILSITESAMNLRWEPGFDGGDEQHFVIRFRKIHATEWTNIRAQLINTYLLEGLVPGTGYELKLLANNVVGSSTETDTLTSSTLNSNITRLDTHEDANQAAQHFNSCTTPLIGGVALACVIGGGIIALILERLIWKLRKKPLNTGKRCTSTGPYDNLQIPSLGLTTIMHSDRSYERCVVDSAQQFQYQSLSDERNFQEYLETPVSTTAVQKQPKPNICTSETVQATADRSDITYTNMI